MVQRSFCTNAVNPTSFHSSYVADFASNTVEFRLVVFRPFKGEIIEGKISGSDQEGIKSMFPSVFGSI